MNSFNNHGPCIDKNCSWCCDPVKLDANKVVNGMQLPKDKDGIDLWKRRDEVFVSKTQPDTSKVLTFDCKNLNKENGECLDYDNRPEICRNSTCINPDSNLSEDEQHKIIIEQEFIKIIPIK